MPNATPIPTRMAHLPRDHRGYPVPWAVFTDSNGRAHFQINDDRKRVHCLTHDCCPICGKKLSRAALRRAMSMPHFIRAPRRSADALRVHAYSPRRLPLSRAHAMPPTTRRLMTTTGRRCCSITPWSSAGPIYSSPRWRARSGSPGPTCARVALHPRRVLAPRHAIARPRSVAAEADRATLQTDRGEEPWPAESNHPQVMT